MEIPLPTPKENDIYSYGFDKSLNREETVKEINPTIYDPLTGAINPTLIQSGNVTGLINVADGSIKSNNFVKGSTGWEIASNGDVEFNVGHFRGTLTAGAIDIPDTLIVHSFHVDQNGNTWWGATALIDGTAKVLNTGEASFKSVNITGGTAVTTILSGEVAQGNLNVANRGWSQTCVFSPTSSLYISWASGSFITANGTTYNIGAGSTGVMAARHYIYLDTGVATNAYQTITVAATAVGAGKVLVATAINATTEAAFQTFGGLGGQNILGEDIAFNSLTGSAIVANSITGNEIAANAITASKIDVGYLSAISADLGTITAAKITIDTAGHIKGGQTNFNTGTGFLLGYSTDAYKLSIGSPTGDYFTYDGTSIITNAIKLSLNSAILLGGVDTERNGNDISYTKVKELKVSSGGSITVKFSLKNQSGPGYTAYARIYKNGVAIGTERSRSLATYLEYSEDFTGIKAGDLIQLYCKSPDDYYFVKEFRIYASFVEAILD